MKLYTYTDDTDQTRIGAEINGRLHDLTDTHGLLAATQGGKCGGFEVLPSDMLELIQLGEAGLHAAREVIVFAGRGLGALPTWSPAEVQILAPLPRPGKILCSGINYRGHMQENPNATMPAEPFFFSKLPTAVIGPGQPIVKPKRTEQMDYEVEFAVVIGRKMKNTPEGEVIRHIFGYTILHDVSARDVQFKDYQITLGKNFDTFCPLGPCIVTTDELTNPGNVKLRSLVNGEVMQDGTTADWVFSLPVLLSRLSQVMTLEPGDIVSTGTPAGVGAFRKPPVFLQPGDVVRLEVEGIGVLENPVVGEE